MTGHQLHTARLSFGLTQTEFARLIGEGDKPGVERKIRAWETGERPVPGPVQVLMKWARVSPEIRGHLGLREPT